MAKMAIDLDKLMRLHAEREGYQLRAEIEGYEAQVTTLVKAARRAYDVADADTPLWAELRFALEPFKQEVDRD